MIKFGNWKPCMSICRKALDIADSELFTCGMFSFGIWSKWLESRVNKPLSSFPYTWHMIINLVGQTKFSSQDLTLCPLQKIEFFPTPFLHTVQGYLSEVCNVWRSLPKVASTTIQTLKMWHLKHRFRIFFIS